MRYANRRVQEIEAATVEIEAAMQEIREAAREGREFNYTRLNAATERRKTAEQLPAAEFLCAQCKCIEDTLERVTLVVIGYVVKDKQGEVVESVNYGTDSPREMTLCAGCADESHVRRYLRLDAMPEPAQLKRLFPHAVSTPVHRRKRRSA